MPLPIVYHGGEQWTIKTYPAMIMDTNVVTGMACVRLEAMLLNGSDFYMCACEPIVPHTRERQTYETVIRKFVGLHSSTDPYVYFHLRFAFTLGADTELEEDPTQVAIIGICCSRCFKQPSRRAGDMTMPPSPILTCSPSARSTTRANEAVIPDWDKWGTFRSRRDDVTPSRP